MGDLVPQQRRIVLWGSPNVCPYPLRHKEAIPPDNHCSKRHIVQRLGAKALMEEFLLKLLNTLNNIEVKGKENLVQLATAIMAAEQKLEELRTEETDGE